MGNSRWERLQSLFGQAVLLEDQKRQQFLDEACGDDQDFRRELEALLEADKDPARITSFALDAEFDHALDDKLVGTTIDAWELAERIGAGGMSKRSWRSTQR